MKDCFKYICCIVCHVGAVAPSDDGKYVICQQCGANYVTIIGRPVLLRRDNAIFSPDAYMSVASSVVGRRSSLSRFIPGTSVNLARERVLRDMREYLDRSGRGAILVVGGGRQREWLTPLMLATHPHEIIYTDIDASADVDMFCDAHDLPFFDDVFDAVITTAVLEHVMYPERVASEIGRVLKTDGVLYSELPFMQQVHEGAYDFTRYTLSGHRRLFRYFAELQSGMVAGPGTALAWAMENFALAFFSGRRTRLVAKGAVRCLFFWLKYFDYLLVNRPEAMDGASCTFFLGTKSDTPVADAEIIRRYVGAKHLLHV